MNKRQLLVIAMFTPFLFLFVYLIYDHTRIENIFITNSTSDQIKVIFSGKEYREEIISPGSDFKYKNNDNSKIKNFIIQVVDKGVEKTLSLKIGIIESGDLFLSYDGTQLKRINN